MPEVWHECNQHEWAFGGVQMAGGLGRDSAQLGFGMRSLSLSSSVADDGAEPNGETAANGDAAPAQPEERDDPNEPQDVKVFVIYHLI